MTDGLTFTPAELAAMGRKVVGNRAVPISDQTGMSPLWTSEHREHSTPRYGLAPNGRAFKSKTEARYAEYLDVRLRSQLIRWWEYEPISLVIGVDVTYRPDFFVWPNVLDAQGPQHTLIAKLEAHEVKGGNYWRDLGKAKFRIAPPLYPWLIFKGVTFEGGTWRLVETHNA